ncbi:hypothetical protein TH63_15150 [Rufibacter radiotolerans]|uniref:Uncharacterized protein n=1 Tax=Rufibacter radiotolerans TaxID=1379910 RepID=A0A0H4VLI3_9BACT|nr:hypothetical protein TH63_15150 [Rufibacter radiotolerans]
MIEDPIMTAKVNGRDFTACKGSGKNIALPKDNVEISYSGDNTLKIKGTDSCKDTMRVIRLEIRNITGPGTYVLDHATTPQGTSTGNTASLQFPYFRPANLTGPLTTDAQHTGRVILTEFDAAQRVLSGTFEMDLYDASSGLLYRVREGKLDKASF